MSTAMATMQQQPKCRSSVAESELKDVASNAEVKRQRTFDSVERAKRQKNQQQELGPPMEWTPLLPPEIWSLVITDHLHYQDVMSFSAACHSFLHQVLPLVPRLFFSHAKELHAAQARRFASGCVTEIKIYSYITHEPILNDSNNNNDGNNDNDGNISFRQKIDKDTLFRIVPFVSQFPKLRFLFVGGIEQGKERIILYNVGVSDTMEFRDDVYNTCRNDDFFRQGWVWTKSESSNGVRYSSKDEELHNGLVRSFCGAFVSGYFSQKLFIHGAIGSWKCIRRRGGCDGLCREVFRSFPMLHVEAFLWFADKPDPFTYSGTCLSVKERMTIIASRPGGREFLKSPERVVRLLRHWTTDSSIVNSASLEMETIRELVSVYGCNPSLINPDRLNPPDPDCRIKASTVQELRSLGVPFPTDYFVNVIEDDKEFLNF